MLPGGKFKKLGLASKTYFSTLETIFNERKVLLVFPL